MTRAHPPPPRRLARARRAIAHIAAAAGLTSTFTVAMAAGVLLHADTPEARRLLARSLTHLLTESLEGSITIEEIGELGLRGIDGGKATVRDPEGQTVLIADGIRIRASLPELAYKALFQPAELLTLRRVRVERAEVTLTSDERGELGIARAFSPKARPGSEDPTDEKASTSPTLWLPAVRIRHAIVRGELSPKAGVRIPLDVELRQLKGSVLAGPEQTSIRADRFGLVGRKLDVRLLAGDSAKPSTEARGTAEARIDIPSASGAPLGGFASFDGWIDEVQTSLRGSLDGDRVDLFCDLPRAEPEALRALFPDLPVYDVVALHAKVEGSLPHLDASLRLHVGEGEVVAEGPVTVGEEPHAELALALRKLDIRAIEPTAPATSLDGKGSLTLRLPSATGLEGGFDFRTEPTSIEGFALPPVSMRGSFEQSRLQTSATIHAPGMPIEVRKLAIRPAARGSGVTVEIEADGDVPSIQRAKALSGIAKGRAHWYARGTLTAGRLDSHLGVLLNDLERDDVKVEQAAIVGRLTGPLDRLQLDASLVGRQVHMGGLVFRNMRATALGPLTRPKIVASLEHDALPLFTARGRVRTAKAGLAISDLELEAKRRDRIVTARAPRASIGAEGLGLPAFAVEGLGEPLEGSLQWGPAGLSLAARSEGIDIGLLAALVDARAQAMERIVRSRNSVLRDVFPVLWSNYVDGMRAELDVSLVQNRSEERGSLRLGLEHATRTALPELRVSADLRVEGGRLAGDGITIALGDLASMTALPEEARLAGSILEPSSWERVTGKLSLRSSLDFDELERLTQLLPESALPLKKLGGTLSTRLSVKREEGDALPDVELSTTTKGLQVVAAPADDDEDLPAWASKDLDLAVSGSLGWREERARLRMALSRSGRELAEVSLEAQPPFEKILSAPQRARALLREMPLSVSLRVPRTSIASLPDFLRPGWFEGDVELTGDLHGSLEMPIVTFEAGGYGLVSGDRGDVPLVLGAYATYGFSETDVQLRVTEPSGGDVTASATVQAKLDDLLAPPLLEDDPSAGFIERLRRFLLEKTAADAKFRANAFRVAPFQPLVDHVFTQLDGRIDGSFRVRQQPEEGGVRRSLDGVADITQGVFQLPEIGRELHGATAHIVADGDKSVHVQDIAASGITGRVTGDVTITHQNLAFESLEARLAIAERERLPLTLEGVSFGEAWGRVQVSMRKGTDDGGLPATLVNVQIPELHVDLPASSTRDVQPLGDNPKIHIGRRMPDGELHPIALGPPREARDESRWLVHFHLGDRVTLRQGTLLQLGITGAPRMAVTDRAYVSGDVWLTGGYVEVFGKRFDVVYGSARFHPATDPGNPWVAVSARWDAPDATRVYADYVGPIKAGTLTLRSEPARTPSEILALVLLGTVASDLEASSQQSEVGSAAAGVGSSLATAGLNRALSGVTGTTITTRVDTSVAQNPRPEVAIRLSDSVTAQVAYSTGLPAPGQNPDRVLVTLGWNFRQSWSLSTTVGDKGSSVVDVIWQYRY